MGYFREYPRGSQNLVPPGAGLDVRKPVFDDSYTLGALFGCPVPDRCRIPLGHPRDPKRDPPGTPKRPQKGSPGTADGASPGPPWKPPGIPQGPPREPLRDLPVTPQGLSILILFCSILV